MYFCVQIFLLLISPADALFMYFLLNKVSLHISISLVEFAVVCMHLWCWKTISGSMCTVYVRRGTLIWVVID